jgi:hypothetical protein
MNFSKAELIPITITSVQAFFLIDFSTTDLVPCPLNIWVFEFIGKKIKEAWLNLIQKI